MKINIGGTEYSSKFCETKAAEEFKAMLSLTLDMSELNYTTEALSAPEKTDQRTVTADDRFDKWLAVQVQILGDFIYYMRENVPQAKAHAAANINVGNMKELLIRALTTCLLYIGCPRLLNALNCIN